MLGLVAASLIVYAVGGLGSLVLRRSEGIAIPVAGVAAACGGLLGVIAALPVLMSGHGEDFSTSGPFPFANFSVRFDPLAALMVLMISIVSVMAGIYSLSYVKDYAGRGVGALGFFLNFFIASMVLVVVVDNAFYFLLFWEMMTIASYFLVIFEQDQEAVDAGFLYFFIAHAFSMLIMVAFLLLFLHTGSLDFASFRGAKLPAWLASVVFVLAFFGFAAKAGMIPLHVWLPRAHPAAPSHASALMSGVMLKLGIYGIVRVGVEFLGATAVWWGWMVLAFGAVSAVLGILYALAERDIKCMLAYSSVENIGIILMATGLTLVGIANGQPLLASLGLIAALYHLLNHAIFKPLLFLGAGALLYSAHTRDMGTMGALGRRMPWTALCFLVGALSISAIPPLNGFVSEWLLYQTFLTAGSSAEFASRLLGPIAAVMLAITGALALMSFVRAWGMVFAGGARSDLAADAREVPGAMLVAMGALALLCILLGVCAPLVATILSSVSTTTLGMDRLQVASGLLLFPGSPNQAVLSPPLIALLLIGLLVVPLFVAALRRGRHAQPRIAAEAWACGYQHTPQMTVSVAGFAEPPRVMLRSLFLLRTSRRPVNHVIEASVQDATLVARRVEPIWDEVTTNLAVQGVEVLGRHAQALEAGDLRIYCVYILVALAALLVALAW